jgi:hypothetical protein
MNHQLTLKSYPLRMLDGQNRHVTATMMERLMLFVFRFVSHFSLFKYLNIANVDSLSM